LARTSRFREGVARQSPRPGGSDETPQATPRLLDPAARGGGVPDGPGRRPAHRRRWIRRRARDRGARGRGHDQQRYRRDPGDAGLSQHRATPGRGAVHLSRPEGRVGGQLQHVDQRQGDGRRGDREGARTQDLRQLQAAEARSRPAGTSRLQDLRAAHLSHRARGRAADPGRLPRTSCACNRPRAAPSWSPRSARRTPTRTPTACSTSSS